MPTKSPKSSNPPFKLDNYIVSVLRDEPFFAALSRKLEKRASKAIPTAGVMLNKEKGRFELLYNPDFFAKIAARDEKFIKGILLHEFWHIVLLHVTSRLPSGKMSKRWNYATDLAINSELSKWSSNADTPSGWKLVETILPEEALFPTVGQFEKFEPNLSSEEYMTLLKDMEESDESGDQGDEGEGDEKQDGNGDSDGPDSPSDDAGDEDGQGRGAGAGEPGEGNSDPSSNGFDDHSDWGEGDDTERTIAEERIREAIKEAYIEASSKGFGSVSAGMKREIKEIITPKVNWRSILRSFVKQSQRCDRTSTIKRLNRRYAYIHPGRKANRQAKIAVSIDQSGSVSDSMLATFYNELEKLAVLADFTIVPFDTEVVEEHIHVWKKGERHNKTRYRYGGTCFNAPTKWVNEQRFDGHIVLTDMEAPKPVSSKCQRMWMTTKACAERPYFQTNERIIAIDE